MLDDAIRRVIREELERERPQLAQEAAARVLERLSMDRAAERFLAPREAGELVGYSAETICELIASGHLQRYGRGRPRVKLSELIAYMEGRATRTVGEAANDDHERRVNAIVAGLKSRQ